jgi:AcrR family transcriptional regulator
MTSVYIFRNDDPAMTDKKKESGWRGSRDVWLNAALTALIDGGVDAVKIQPLASEMDLSRTSFYWFFKNRADLLGALLDHWEGLNTANLLEAASAYAATANEAVLNVIACFIDSTQFDQRLEFAIRGWALQSPEVMTRLRDNDQQRISALQTMLQSHGYDRQDAYVRTSTLYHGQIGYISMQVEETLDTRMKRVPFYTRTYTGTAPSDDELARF